LARQIFVNYRRDDSAPHALNVAQYLEREFGGANVFLDIDRLRADEKFSRVLEERLAASAVMIAIIGPQWLTATDDDGQRRLDDPEDWVRMEISRALARGIPVIPVLVAGAPLPKKGQLPEALRPLIEHHVATLTTNGFRNEMAGLARDIPRTRWPFVAAASATVLIAIAAGIFLGLMPAIDSGVLWRTHRDQPTASKDPTTTN
jgi:TIR domain